MTCKHKRIMSKNCELYCLDCGEKLPADFVADKPAPNATEAAETPEKGQKTATKRTSRKGAK